MSENGELDYRPKKETPLPRLQNVLGIAVHTQDAESGESLEAQGQANLVHTASSRPARAGWQDNASNKTKQHKKETAISF